MSRDENSCVSPSCWRVRQRRPAVPVGAVVVYNGEIIASAKNRREGNRCATAHAELLALSRPAQSWQLAVVWLRALCDA